MTIRSLIDQLKTSIIQPGKSSGSIRRVPYMVVWNFTNMCNLRCKHCYQDAKDKGTPDELTLEEKLEFVEVMHRTGVKVPVISGGEPLIHPDFFPVLDMMVEKGMHVAVASNATMITPKFARKLKEHGLAYIEISLDSVNPEKHDEFRGAKGCWDRTVNGINNCIESGIFTAVATVFTKNTLDEVDAMVDFASELGANRFIHFNFVPTGRAPGIVEQDLSPEEREYVLSRLFKKRRTAGLEVLSTAPQYGRACLEGALGDRLDKDLLYVETKAQKQQQFYVQSPTHYDMLRDNRSEVPLESLQGCGAGRQFCCIQPNGDVTPCMFIPSWVEGSIRDESFQVIWERFGEIPCFTDRNSLEDECGSCQFRYLCGGCRARAINYIGNPLAADTGCIKNKDKWLKEQGKI
ncbi:radical SAM protein [Candidatus Bathyarchaeota archaeon]|nr:radical SAM protein [Candidatus Bathyarchaeota archaeon]